jgi:fused signal recognition particle receptor
MGLLDKFKQGLKKTAQLLRTDIRDLFKAEGRLVDAVFLEELFERLVKTDMGVQAAQSVVDEIGTAFQARVVTMEEILDRIKQQLRVLLAQPSEPIRFAASGPTVIMVAGVNGSGKTTSIAKLARMFQADGKSVVLGAADTFRAAAVEQLTIWAKRACWASRSPRPRTKSSSCWTPPPGRTASARRSTSPRRSAAPD